MLDYMDIIDIVVIVSGMVRILSYPVTHLGHNMSTPAFLHHDLCHCEDGRPFVLSASAGRQTAGACSKGKGEVEDVLVRSLESVLVVGIKGVIKDGLKGMLEGALEGVGRHSIKAVEGRGIINQPHTRV